MGSLEDLLIDFAKRADKILKEELKKFNVKYGSAEARMVINIRSVGVQGDKRTYGYPALIELTYDKSFVWDQEEFVRVLSNRITNEVKENYGGEEVVVNKVLYFLKER